MSFYYTVCVCVCVCRYHPGEEFQMTFWCNREDSIDDPRYTVIIVDSITNSSQNGKYAAFIVPQGRCVLVV